MIAHGGLSESEDILGGWDTRSFPYWPNFTQFETEDRYCVMLNFPICPVEMF